MHEFVQIDIPVWSLYFFHEAIIDCIKDMTGFIDSEPLPLCQRDQMILFQQLGVKQSIFETAHSSEIDSILMELLENFELFRVQYFRIDDAFVMLVVGFGFV